MRVWLAGAGGLVALAGAMLWLTIVAPPTLEDHELYYVDGMNRVLTAVTALIVSAVAVVIAATVIGPQLATLNRASRDAIRATGIPAVTIGAVAWLCAGLLTIAFLPGVTPVYGGGGQLVGIVEPSPSDSRQGTLFERTDTIVFTRHDTIVRLGGGRDDTCVRRGTVVDCSAGAESSSSSAPRPQPEPPATPFAEAEGAVRSLLADSVAATGMDADIVVHTVECEAGGRKASGGLVIPVLEVHTDPDIPFDAIVQVWRGAGLHYDTRATGTDLWAGAIVERASMRGTTDGLRLSAETGCLEG